METSWRETGGGEIVIEHDVPMGPRLIIGSMLAPMAAFFLYHLVNGLTEYVRHATAAEWLRALPGLLLLLALSLGLGVPTWLVLAGRSRVVVDRHRGRISKVLDFRLFRWSMGFPTERVREVRVRRKTLRTSGHSSRTWEVQVFFAGPPKPMVVGYEDVETDARELSRRLAVCLRVETPEEPVAEEEHLPDSEPPSACPDDRA